MNKSESLFDVDDMVEEQNDAKIWCVEDMRLMQNEKGKK